MRLAVVWLGLSTLVVVPIAARADGEAMQPGSGSGDQAGSTSNRINIRVGTATSDSTNRPTICLDVRIAAGFGAESCGTGQGIIHDQPGTELAHFRGTWSFFSRRMTTGTARLRGGIGWAELQVGVDHPGFHFGAPDPTEKGSVAGPDGSLQAQYLVPLGKGVEAIASLTAGVAVFAKADQLIIPQSNVQPYVSGEIGFGW